MNSENNQDLHDSCEIVNNPLFVEYANKHHKSESGRGYSSPWHTPGNHYQSEMECTEVGRWADRLYEQRGIDIRDIHKVDKFPDCVGMLDGKPIGIELTELTVDKTERRNKYKVEQKRQWKMLSEEFQRRFDHMPPLEPMGDWSLGKFQRKLKETFQKKDETARTHQEILRPMLLRRLFLVIMFDDGFLDDDLVRCIQETRLPRPKYFSDVYVFTEDDLFEVCFLPCL